MKALRPLLAASVALPALALLATGTTTAAFSDTATIEGNTVSAATVVIGDASDAAPGLSFEPLAPGNPVAAQLYLAYTGSVPADIHLEVDTRASSACDGSGGPRQGGEVQIRIAGSDWAAYCNADPTRLVLRESAAPSERFTVRVEARLAPGTGHRYSDLVVFDPLVVRAVQPAGGIFSDYATGTLRLSTATIAPLVPHECSAKGRKYQEVVVLRDDQRHWDAAQERGQGAGPFAVIGTDGDDTIIGSNKDDCLVGGDGDDVLDGREGDDVLLGGPGNDRLLGGNGKDDLDGGPGDDVLDGGNGRDDVRGGDGNDTCTTGTSPDDVLSGCELTPATRPAADDEPPPVPRPASGPGPSSLPARGSTPVPSGALGAEPARRPGPTATSEARPAPTVAGPDPGVSEQGTELSAEPEPASGS